MKFAKLLGLRKPSSSSLAAAPAGLGSSPSRSPTQYGSGLSRAVSPLGSPCNGWSKKELEAVFRFMDTNRDGKISPEELQAVLRSLGDNPSEEELQGMLGEVDVDGDGFISWEEFLSFNTGSAASLDDLKAAFHMFDVDGNGYISPEELHQVLLALGEKGLTREECRRMIRGVDVDGDGFVDFEEFKLMMAASA